MYKKVPTDMNFVGREKEVEKFWDENHIFEKSIEEREGCPDYIFYDGPPTANGKPHIGHAYEKILTDIIARHYTLRCDDVFFLTGTDEHGVKIQKTAAAQGITPKELCDINSQAFKDAWKALDVDYTKFIRTTDDYHEAVVQKIFKKLVEQGDIYKHEYEGLYCSGCECFLNPKDLTEDGLCPDHLKKPEVVSEVNYFFRLSKYKDAIIKHIKENQIFYRTYFKLNKDQNFIVREYDNNLAKNFFNDQYIDYHMEFFKAGLNAIIKKWLNNGCKESPEEIDLILKDEYKNKNT